MYHELVSFNDSGDKVDKEPTDNVSTLTKAITVLKTTKTEKIIEK